VLHLSAKNPCDVISYQRSVTSCRIPLYAKEGYRSSVRPYEFEKLIGIELAENLGLVGINEDF
jgi:hypothetical protein